MKVTQQEAVDRQAVLHVELEEDDLASYVDMGYRRVVGRLNIPGFRRGKAPRHIVERYVGRESLLNEVMDRMVSEVATKAVEEMNLEASDLPSVDVLDMDPVQLRVTVPLTPEVHLGDYKAIRIPYEEPQVEEAEVQARLEALRQQMATWEPVDRPAQMGDLLTIDVEGTSEGQTVVSAQEAQFVPQEPDQEGQEPVLPGFSAQLVGMSKEETKEFTLTAPEDHPNEELRGKEVHFKVTLLDIKERRLPELDDELAKALGQGHESLEELTKAIREEMEGRAKAEAQAQYREKVLEALMEGTTVELPPLMVEHEAQHILRDQLDTLAQLNIRLDDYLLRVGKTQEELVEEARQSARRRLERDQTLRKVAQAEGLEVSDEEVDQRIREFIEEAQREGRQEELGLPEDPGQVAPEARARIKDSMLIEKTLDLLISLAKGPAEEPQGEEAEASQEGQEEDREQEERGDVDPS